MPPRRRLRARRTTRRPAGSRRGLRFKRRTYRNRRAYKRGARLSVKRTCYLGNFQPSPTNVNTFWNYITPSLNKGFQWGGAAVGGGLSNVTEYSAMFERYRLNGVKITLKPRSAMTVMPQDAVTNTIRKGYWSVIKDPFSNTVPLGSYNAATLNSFLENGRVRTFRADRDLSIYMKPWVIEQYGGGANRYVRPKWTDLSTDGQNVLYRGFHLMAHMQDPASAPNFDTFDVYITYYIQFAGMK